MPPTASTVGALSSDQALHELDDLLEELSRLGATMGATPEYHAEWLARAGQGLGALAGTVWMYSASDGWRRDAQFDRTGEPWLARLTAEGAHGRVLEEVAQADRPRFVPAGAAVGADVLNPTTQNLLLGPIARDDEGAVVVELLQRPGGSPAAQDGYLRLLEAFCDLAAEFHHKRRVQAWREQAELAGRRERFVERLHGSLEPSTVATTAVNDGRLLIGCDRVSVVALRNRRAKLLAVSGLDLADPRAHFTRLNEALCRRLSETGEAVWHGMDDDPAAAPDRGRELAAWLEESQARAAAVLPLVVPQEADGPSAAAAPIGVLICEWFGGTSASEPRRETVAWVARQAASALENALAHRELPFFPAMQGLARLKKAIGVQRWPRLAVFGAGLAGLAAVLSFVPADFDVSGRGTLQPAVRREVFAGSDGIVAELFVEHDAPCRQGDLLVRLSRSQLDFEFSRLAGEMQTTRARLGVIQASRLESTPQTAAERDRQFQLAAEEEELKELLGNLDEQQTILRTQQEELSVRSPIDGFVITWNVRELLEARPVQRGQALLTVADVDGPWVVEVEVPDERMGHVLDAQRVLGPNLEVSFLLATDPGRTYRGTVEKVARATEVRPAEPAHVLVTVAFDRNQVSQLRPGATVAPRLHCGKKPLGYVWFHGIWEAIQRYVLF
ncbi:MAG: HlyD family efflux transporter periplasmic adaptor subunit [Planctomycetaceae bacterium]